MSTVEKATANREERTATAKSTAPVIPAFVAVLSKELKENAKWALVVAIALAGSLYFVIRAVLPIKDGDTLVSLWNGIDLTTLICAALGGILIGALQTLPEQRKDLRDFLVHRPVPTGLICWAKVAAGLSLLVVSVCIPLLLTAEWLRTPGHVAAPFSWSLLIPPAIAASASVILYFATFLVVVRAARWYGSRAIPILGAIVCAAMAVNADTAWLIALGTAVCVVVFALAARGSYVSRGLVDHQSPVSNCAIAASLYSGQFAIVAILSSAVAGIWFSAPPHATPAVGLPMGYGMLKSGSPIQLVGNRGRGFDTITFGESLTRPKWAVQLTPETMLTTNQLTWDESSDGPAPIVSPDTYIIPADGLAYEGTGDSTGCWYYDPTQRLFVRFSIATKRAVRYLGPRGFSEPGSTASSGFFPADFQEFGDYGAGEGALIDFGSTAFSVSFTSGTVQRFSLGRIGGRVKNVGLVGHVPYPQQVLDTIGPSSGSTRSQWSEHGYFAVVTSSLLTFVSGTDGRLFTAPNYPSLYPETDAAVNEDGSRFYVFYGGTSGEQKAALVVYSREGSVLQRFSLPSLNLAASSDTANFDASNEVQAAVVLPASTILPMLRPIAMGDFGAGVQPTTQYNRTVIVVVSLLSSALSCILGFLVSRRWGDRPWRSVAWAGLCLLLGLPALLVMISLRSWPARERCPNCHRKRVVDRQTCEYCGVEFGRPVADGTEVFE